MFIRCHNNVDEKIEWIDIVTGKYSRYNIKLEFDKLYEFCELSGLFIFEHDMTCDECPNYLQGMGTRSFPKRK